MTNINSKAKFVNKISLQMKLTVYFPLHLKNFSRKDKTVTNESKIRSIFSTPESNLSGCYYMIAQRGIRDLILGAIHVAFKQNPASQLILLTLV